MQQHSFAAVSPRLVRTATAAKYLGVSRATLHRLIVSRQIPYIDSLKWRLVDIRDLDAWVDRQKVSA
jgi:excisionase family DNA binding protein